MKFRWVALLVLVIALAPSLVGDVSQQLVEAVLTWGLELVREAK